MRSFQLTRPWQQQKTEGKGLFAFPDKAKPYVVRPDTRRINDDHLGTVGSVFDPVTKYFPGSQTRLRGQRNEQRLQEPSFLFANQQQAGPGKNN